MAQAIKLNNNTYLDSSGIYDINIGLNLNILNNRLNSIINTGVESAQFVNLTGTCQLASYRKTALALCKVDTTPLTGSNSWSAGDLYFHRVNGLYCGKWFHFLADNQYAEAYTYNLAPLTNIQYNNNMTPTSGEGYKPCVFRYNNIWYGGIYFEISAAEAGYVYFVGVGNFKPFALDVYDTNPGTVLNSEVYNSLSFSNCSIDSNLYVGTRSI